MGTLVDDRAETLAGTEFCRKIKDIFRTVLTMIQGNLHYEFLVVIA